MRAIEIARKLSVLGQTKDACDAYLLALQTNDVQPVEKLESAAFILNAGGNYRVSYTCFQELYNEGYFRSEILPLMSKVFYEPNEKMMKSRYERNCKLLSRYPYFFRKDFPAFDQLPIRFFPYDDHNGYVPFYRNEERFGGYINVKNPVISRNFFRDLENPILAKDVFSQYELEYLNDNVRKSEYVAKENHIYLHYTDWEVFCSWMQVLSVRPLLEDKKFVFLIGEEIQQYPIDFKERFGLDYSQYSVKPIGIREVNRMIWHTQLSTHNGGDFFNEIFDAHPNLLVLPSIMFKNMEEQVKSLRKHLRDARSPQDLMQTIRNMRDMPYLADELYRMRNITDKDLMVVMYLVQKDFQSNLDPSSRIAPAVFFQPHFYNINYDLRANENGNTVLEAGNIDAIHNSPLFREFKYIKTFTPMRRFTTSHGATVKFMFTIAQMDKDAQIAMGIMEEEASKTNVVSDAVTERVLNRSFMIDPEDRLYKDSVLVRFEDGKLNPKATFTALAAFLDLPYTETMTYCSEKGDKNFGTIGFDTSSVYKTYDEYANDSERYFIEYFLRDAYEYYGYDFNYYDGKPVDEEKIASLIKDFTTINHYIRETWRKIFEKTEVTRKDGESVDEETTEKIQKKLLENYIADFNKNRFYNAKILMEDLRFVNKKGQPLRFMKRLELDSALLEQPLYH